MSLVLKAMQKRVTYHDGFRFNQDVATTLLSDKVAMDRADVLDFVSQVGNDPGIVAVAFRGIYYTDDENAWID
ncbi:hypothetical protein, partial [Acinetobacter baumannii]|uniref:hypothetical protein n=1 Tax=Acinetobacter baumannii TaxID=470 RepID=UPI001C085F79